MSQKLKRLKPQRLTTPTDRLATIADFRNPRCYVMTSYDGSTVTKDCDITKLHTRLVVYAHEFQQALIRMHQHGRLSQPWQIAEGWRPPDRQMELFVSGFSRHQAWQSAHQYGMAIDIAPMGDDVCAAMTDWPTLLDTASRFGLACPEGEPMGHLEHYDWQQWLQTFRYPEYLERIPSQPGTLDFRKMRTIKTRRKLP